MSFCGLSTAGARLASALMWADRFGTVGERAIDGTRRPRSFRCVGSEPALGVMFPSASVGALTVDELALFGAQRFLSGS